MAIMSSTPGSLFGINNENKTKVMTLELRTTQPRKNQLVGMMKNEELN
jgi:hypothetical protein